MLNQPLRGYGPRVFISYSFADAAIAERLEVFLVARGFQVRREDESSLFNQRLAEALPRRMADAEVFIQLLTATANRSPWVEREFEWMTQQREAGSDVAFLPIVFDKATLPDRVREWWYMDPSGGDLSQAALEAIAHFCLKSVHLLRLNEDDPMTVRDDDLRAALAEVPQDRRRIILDSDGKLFRWAQDTLDSAEGVEGTASFLAHETSRLEQTITRLKVRDEVARKLVIELMREMETYTHPSDRITSAVEPMQRYFRVILSEHVVKAADQAAVSHPLNTLLKHRIDAARQANLESHSPWYLNPGLYAWAFGVREGGGAMSELNLHAPGFRSVAVLLPTRVFGDMADVYTRPGISFNPRQEFLASTFIDYILPQIAINASYFLPDYTTARQDLEQKYGWRLEQYNRAD